MIKALVKEFRNDESLETELNAFLARWQNRHGAALPILFISSHTPRYPSHSAGSEKLDPFHVDYTFFYRETKPDNEQDLL